MWKCPLKQETRHSTLLTFSLLCFYIEFWPVMAKLFLNTPVANVFFLLVLPQRLCATIYQKQGKASIQNQFIYGIFRNMRNTVKSCLSLPFVSNLWLNPAYTWQRWCSFVIIKGLHHSKMCTMNFASLKHMPVKRIKLRIHHITLQYGRRSFHMNIKRKEPLPAVINLPDCLISIVFKYFVLII